MKQHWKNGSGRAPLSQGIQLHTWPKQSIRGVPASSVVSYSLPRESPKFLPFLAPSWDKARMLRVRGPGPRVWSPGPFSLQGCSQGFCEGTGPLIALSSKQCRLCGPFWAPASSEIPRSASVKRRLRLTLSPQQQTQRLYCLLCRGHREEELLVRPELQA